MTLESNHAEDLFVLVRDKADNEEWVSIEELGKKVFGSAIKDTKKTVKTLGQKMKNAFNGEYP